MTPLFQPKKLLRAAVINPRSRQPSSPAVVGRPALNAAARPVARSVRYVRNPLQRQV